MGNGGGGGMKEVRGGGVAQWGERDGEKVGGEREKG